MKIALVINTYDRVVDAKIQINIVKKYWSKQSNLRDIDIYHIFNGRKGWYKNKNLEDHLIRCKNPGPYKGAGLMIDAGIKNVLKNKGYDYIIVTSADVWLIKPKILEDILIKMERNKYLLATSIWFFQKALSTEFFIVDTKFAKKVFPLQVDLFLKNNKMLSLLSKKPINKPILEICFWNKVKNCIRCKNIKASSEIMWLPGRKYVHWLNHRYDKTFGYLSQHNIKEKINILKEEGLDKYI